MKNKKRFLQVVISAVAVAALAVPSVVAFAYEGPKAEVIVKDAEKLLVNISTQERIDEVEINADGVYAIVDDTKKQIGYMPNNHKINFEDARVIRSLEGQESTVMHYNTDTSLMLTTTAHGNLYIVPRIAEPFTDVEITDSFHKDVEDAYNYLIASGTTATEYSPNASITRAQFSVMIARTLEEGLNHGDYPWYSLTDLNGKWYANEVQFLVERGIITGYSNGKFGGNDTITREQATAIIVRILHYLSTEIETGELVTLKDAHKVSLYAKKAVQFLVEQNIIPDDVNFNPQDNLTRAEMAQILMPAIKLTSFY